MPRHLHTALDHLIGLLDEDRDFVECEYAPWEYKPARERTTFENYLVSWRGWYAAGLELDSDARRRVHTLWGERPMLRPRLRALTESYPCAELERIAFDHVERGGIVNFPAWFHWAPRLEGMWRRIVVERARKFNTPSTAIDAGIIWARWFGGGDEAYRAVACAFNRHARVHRKNPELRVREDFIRHCLEIHQDITEYEARRINAHLIAMDCDLLQVGQAWVPDPDEPAKQEYRRTLSSPFVGDVESLRDSSRTFAGSAWNADDTEAYAAAIRRARIGLLPAGGSG